MSKLTGSCGIGVFFALLDVAGCTGDTLGSVPMGAGAAGSGMLAGSSRSGGAGQMGVGVAGAGGAAVAAAGSGAGRAGGAGASGAPQASDGMDAGAVEPDDGDSGASDGSERRWVTTWGTTLVAADALSALQSFNRVTLRQIVRTSVGGERVRVRFSNVFGTASLQIGAAHVARRRSAAAIDPASDRQLTFAGATSIAIAAGQQVTSDPIAFEVPALADLVISIDLPNQTPGQNVHAFAAQTAYVSRPGSFAGAEDLPGASSISQWFFLDGVDVERSAPGGAVVAFGASIVDGFASTQDANKRWPDELARRLAASARPLGVVNEGYSGNAILEENVGEPATKRFERDVFSNSGVSHVLLTEGHNDLMVFNPTADELIAGMRMLIATARAAGVKFIGGTLGPYEGVEFLGVARHTPEGEATRKAVNEWIRTTPELDGFVDFDAVLRDPTAPSKLLPAFDSGDHIHPSDAGYKAMADAIDLTLLQ